MTRQTKEEMQREYDAMEERARTRAAARRLETEYLIDGSSETASALWSRYQHAGYEQVSTGYWTTVGMAHGVDGKEMPVCFAVDYFHMQGHLFAVFYGTSMVTDSNAIEKAVKKDHPNARGMTNETNIHNAFETLGIKCSLDICKCGQLTGSVPK